MNLEKLAQIGEFMGGISVLLTLVYLAVQIRGNTNAVLSAGAQQTHDTLIQAYIELAGNAQLNRIFRMGTQDINSLTEDETGQFYAFWSATLYVCQNWLYQQKSGALDEELVFTFLGGAASNFHSPGFRAFWTQRKFTFSDELQKWVEDAISKPSLHSDHVPLGPGRKTP